MSAGAGFGQRGCKMVVLFSIRAMALEFARSRAVSSRTMVLLGLIKSAAAAKEGLRLTKKPDKRLTH
ncbi:hypothetical protein LRP_1967 [Ligilactobacillus ruminis]|nr:hypothetical protein LRP_1967 [Ligilactobacillus ruminis]